MLFLGINKQLDLQTFFTASLKYLALEQGWYGQRRLFQKAFILLSVILGVTFMIAMIKVYYKVIKFHFIAVVGLFFLVLFILLRASSFHHMDVFINQKLYGMKLNWILELSGITFVLINALILLKSKPNRV